METSEALEMIKTISMRVSSSFDSIEMETSMGEDSIEVSCFKEGFPVLVFSVEDGVLRVLIGGPQFSLIKTEYQWDTLIELFRLYFCLVYPVYYGFVDFPIFISALVGENVKSWASFAAYLLKNSSVEVYREVNILKVADYTIRVDSEAITLDGPVEVVKEYKDSFELCKILLCYLETILYSNQEDIRFATNPVVENVEDAADPDDSSLTSGPSADVDLDISTEEGVLDIPEPDSEGEDDSLIEEDTDVSE